MVARCDDTSTRWMTSTGVPPRSPPNSHSTCPAAAIAGYLTGTGRFATGLKVRPSVVASTVRAIVMPVVSAGDVGHARPGSRRPGQNAAAAGGR